MSRLQEIRTGYLKHWFAVCVWMGIAFMSLLMIYATMEWLWMFLLGCSLVGIYCRVSELSDYHKEVVRIKSIVRFIRNAIEKNKPLKIMDIPGDPYWVGVILSELKTIKGM